MIIGDFFMYNYIIGIVKQIESNYIVLENQAVGYLIYTANPYKFKLEENYKLYIYQYVREDEISLYGFETLEEKNMFLKLIAVKGLGCKMALPLFATGQINSLIAAIEEENVTYLKKFPKIGDKLAKQMILDLKGKINMTVDAVVEEGNIEELTEVLKGLGYKEKEFKGILPKVDVKLSIEEQVKEALKLLLK